MSWRLDNNTFDFRYKKIIKKIDQFKITLIFMIKFDVSLKKKLMSSGFIFGSRRFLGAEASKTFL